MTAAAAHLAERGQDGFAARQRGDRPGQLTHRRLADSAGAAPVSRFLAVCAGVMGAEQVAHVHHADNVVGGLADDGIAGVGPGR